MLSIKKLVKDQNRARPEVWPELAQHEDRGTVEVRIQMYHESRQGLKVLKKCQKRLLESSIDQPNAGVVKAWHPALHIKKSFVSEVTPVLQKSLKAVKPGEPSLRRFKMLSPHPHGHALKHTKLQIARRFDDLRREVRIQLRSVLESQRHLQTAIANHRPTLK